ncbi:DNA-formamidopyrimidine glycosylase [Metamycoplasma phocicerebrale]|uniref:DNA-(apurinic or apyrimidinic site) lyase n=1 Tax=Metamycoplasma phocicerebrale TaxID=142649 RepID=A0A3T0TUN2_9BACT|nr:DNA-formamidopyrimidine glycosylase [Metamycoplasma phocicerebrale]AZZ65666.1 DNA-formamidopyrimidine glycosylase [Metamycoplasma phocicerebrale]
MPELPEVKVVVNALKEKVLNKIIKDIIVLKPKLFKEDSIDDFKLALKNATIKNIENKGKHIIFKFNNDTILISHLRMEGKYRFYNKSTENHKHLMMKFIFDDKSELHYLDSRMFGTFHLRTNKNYNLLLPLSKIANEPKDIDVNNLYDKLQKTTTAIKTKLLDQTLVAGLGNIYVDEALFASGVSPISPSKNISKKKLLEILTNAQKIMDKSFELGGSTIHTYESLNNKTGEFQNYLKIHSDKIKKCLSCKTEIIKIKLNGRGTYICPHCQKEY